jgi:hypothetical protein
VEAAHGGAIPAHAPTCHEAVLSRPRPLPEPDRSGRTDMEGSLINRAQEVAALGAPDPPAYRLGETYVERRHHDQRRKVITSVIMLGRGSLYRHNQLHRCSTGRLTACGDQMTWVEKTCRGSADALVGKPLPWGRGGRDIVADQRS